MATYIIGDLHGYYDDYRRLLVGAGLVDNDGHWCGNTHQLWLIGDIFDRGEFGVDCVELTMNLQQEARACGGEVNAILGNHEMMLLCARKFGDALTSGGMRVTDQWQMWGGVPVELERLTDHQAAWIAALPAMHMLDDGTLLLHADAMFYVEHGRTPVQVSESLRRIMASDELFRWENTLRAFSEHRAFSALGITGQQRAERLLRYFGARRLVHGHTPIPVARGGPAHHVTEAWCYAGGRCINVDGGIYLGSPGFVHRLDGEIASRAVSPGAV